MLVLNHPTPSPFGSADHYPPVRRRSRAESSSSWAAGLAGLCTVLFLSILLPVPALAQAILGGQSIPSRPALPANSVGVDNSYYFDFTTGNIYGPKSLGQWPPSVIANFGSNTPPISFIGNVPAPNDDGAILTVQNTSLTAAQIYQTFQSTARLFDMVRGVCNLQDGDVLGCQGIAGYVYTTLPHRISYTAGTFTPTHYYTITYVGTTDFTAIGSPTNSVGQRFQANAPGTGTGQAASDADNGVAIFGECIAGGDNAACFTINTAANDLDLNHVSHPAGVGGYELDLNCFNAGSICHAISIIANFHAQPKGGIGLSIANFGNRPSAGVYTGFYVGVNIAAGSIVPPGNGIPGGDAIVIGAVYPALTAALDSLLPSNSNDIAWGFQTSNQSLSTATIVSGGGSGCTPTTYSLVGGTIATHYTLAATVTTSTTQISPAGAVTGVTFASGSGYSALPSNPVTLVAAPGHTDTCATSPTATATWVPSGDSISMFASSNNSINGNFYFADAVTGGVIGLTFAGVNQTITAGAGSDTDGALASNLELTAGGSAFHGFGSVISTSIFVAQSTLFANATLHTTATISSGTPPTLTTGSCSGSAWSGGSTVGRFAAAACTAPAAVSGITGLSRTASASAVLLCSSCTAAVNQVITITGAGVATYNGKWLVTAATTNTSITFLTNTSATDSTTGESAALSPTYIISGMPVATHGYNCFPQNTTTAANTLSPVDSTTNQTTSCVLAGTTAANDFIHLTAVGW